MAHLTVRICMGDACLRQDATLFAHALRGQLKALGLLDDVVISGDYCQSRCREGIIVHLGGIDYAHITPRDAPAIAQACQRLLAEQL